MATNVIMPALEMAQETGKILRWLKAEGEPVEKGELVMEIETDKVTVEIEAPASGVLRGITAQAGDTVPVGQTIAWVLAPGEPVPANSELLQSGRTHHAQTLQAPGAPPALRMQAAPPANSRPVSITASPVARQMAQEHGLDLSEIMPGGGRVEKADVMAYLSHLAPPPSPAVQAMPGKSPASPKARRLAAERGFDLASLRGSGPGGAVLAGDVAAATVAPPQAARPAAAPEVGESVGTVWRVMAERMSASWTTVPHFYLTREVAASALVEMRTHIAPAIEKKTRLKPTFTDLIVKLIAVVLREHPRVNASSTGTGFRLNDDINIGIATAIEQGLIVPVIHQADRLTIGEIALRRQDLVDRANAGKLRPADITGGTFTLTNLGMYNVDAFNAIVNAPQAAILAVGRIADRVVPIDGQPAVRPMMVITVSCDHRVVDGARAARFLDDLVGLIEEPWGLLA